MPMSPCIVNCGNPMCQRECNRAAYENARWDSLPTFDPLPDFATCGNCGADAMTNVTWDGPSAGWSCRVCNATDGDE